MDQPETPEGSPEEVGDGVGSACSELPPDPCSFATGMQSVSAEDQSAVLSEVFAHSPDGMAFIDPDLNIRAANESFGRQIGVPLGKIVGRSVEEVIPGCTEQLGDICRAVRQSGKPFSAEAYPLEFVNQPEQGITYWDCSISPIFSGENTFSGYLLLQREVTGRKRAQEREAESMAALRLTDERLLAANEELAASARASQVTAQEERALKEQMRALNEELRAQSEELQAQSEEIQSQNEELRVRSEELRAQNDALERLNAELENERARLKAIIDNAPEGIVLTDERGRVLLTNSAADRLYARPIPYGDDFDTHSGLQLCHSDGTPFDPRDLPLTRSALDGEAHTGVEMAVVWPDGRRRNLLVNTAPLRDREGNVTGAVGVFQDITERKQAEAERERLLTDLRNANEELVRTELRERELSEEAQRRAAELDAVIASLADGLIIYDAYGEIVRMNPAIEKMLGFSAEELNRPLAERMKMLRAETADGRPLQVEELPLRRALRGETVHGVVVVLHSSDGRPVWVSSSAAPIRSPDGSVLGVVASFTDITALHELEQLRDEYVQLIAHDLRSPLASLMGYAQILYRALSQKGLQREASNAQAILDGARRMNRMIQELVESSKLESGGLEPRKELANLAHLVHHLAERVCPPEALSRVKVECPEWVPTVAVDIDRLERVLDNLITNALKYSDPDTPVVVRVGRSGGEAIVSVIDQGAGIPAEDLPHVFRRFYRAKTQKKAEGLGLGLYITRLLVEAHGGRTWVESEVGKGSAFHFALPLAQPGA